MDKNIKKILCIGDSITNGARNEYFRDYVLELNYLFKSKKIVFLNDSVNGETTSEILKRAIKKISNEKLNTLIFIGGTNDSKVPIPKEIFKRNIETLISVCKKFNINIILGLLPRIYTGLPNYSKIKGNKFINHYNKIIKILAKKNNIVVADLSKLKENFFCDGIHTKNLGCEKIARIIKSSLEKIYASIR